MGRLHASGNYITGIEFSYENYGKTVPIVAAAVASFKDDKGFNDFLELVYDFVAHGNK